MIDFSLIAGTVPRRNRGFKLITFGRVFEQDGRTRLGSDYVAQLYYGKKRSDLRPAGLPSNFLGSVGGFGAVNSEFDGLFVPQLVSLPDVRPGEKFYAQIRVWNPSDGENFEAARDSGGRVGVSNLARVAAGSEIEGPRKLIGIHSFKLKAAR